MSNINNINSGELKLTPREEAVIKRYEISKHKNRPVVNDYIYKIFDDFIELHGDRGFSDDKAIITGLARLNNICVTIIGHVKGKNTNEKIASNFGMPHPEGYRKALRQMILADKFKRPVITFVDTPGAYCGVSAEERGQGEAIARNLLEMSRLKVPVISIITGEGSSGGALGIAQANKVLMLENATYSVISAKGFASILWKDPKREKEAIIKQKMTADDLKSLGVIDGIIPEPNEGAHKDPATAAAAIKTSLELHLEALMKMTPDEIYEQRYKKFRSMGFFNEN
ncbi:MAG: acetyl-CoA carboxylase carboxyltransferase subunit alpha [Oscillospiraceae bacterium]|nr:acetyl-CoA carboxylase carboxyltransferase subunit alpha [Oscillospiraceae bacterium]